MADQGALFEAQQGEETLTVRAVTDRLSRAVGAAFPAEVWVRGEVEGLRPPNPSGHQYFTLCEKARGRDTATLAVALLARSRRQIDRELAAHPSFALANGIEVRVRGRVQLAFGRLQLLLSAIDPVHTLGRLAAERDRVLAALLAEDLLGRNALLPWPVAPLRLAVVTSDGSAACADALHELEASGLGFHVTVVDARVQGQGAEASVLAGLAQAEALRPDVVLLVRGGGARTDLATFESERIARRIAGCTVPVLTGIGHETDTSVADAVAHGAHKTPTACAAAVVERVRTAASRAEGAWGRTAATADAQLGRRERGLATGAAVLAGATERALDDAGHRLAARAQRLSDRATRSAAVADALLDDRLRRAARAAAATLDVGDERLVRAGVRLDPERLARPLVRRGHALALAAGRLRRSATTSMATSGTGLDLLDARVAAVDPARALARGWSITRTGAGELVRSTGDVAPGTTLVTTVADGTVTSTVDASAPEDQS